MSRTESRGKAQRLLEHVQERFFATIDRRPAVAATIVWRMLNPTAGRVPLAALTRRSKQKVQRSSFRLSRTDY